MNENQNLAAKDTTELGVLYKISSLLVECSDLRGTLLSVLETLSNEMGMTRGAIILLDSSGQEAFIDVAYGLSEKQMQRGRYKRGEGVTGRVIETGKPAIVPNLSEEPRFLDRTGARSNLNHSDIVFFCVPIQFGGKIYGALSADRVFASDPRLNENVRLLSIVASMIGQAVQVRYSIEEERKRLMEENERLRSRLQDRFRPENIIGNSNAMRKVFDLIYQVSQSAANVLIRGESGTGKELVASAIHYNSARKDRPFIKVNCAALPETLIESELFGYEKGAFTGAVGSKKGRFELAHTGTLFLDEIGDLSPGTQVKLLRVLQEKEFERLGGIKTVKINVRVIAATNQNLEQLVEQKTFREDLYYRLNVFPIYVPPLRERKTDILLLADYFLEKYAKANSKDIRRISTPAIDMLMQYHWPGNVRELENCIERAVLLSYENVIREYHLPPTLQTDTATKTSKSEEGTLKSLVESYEREIIVEALKRTRGNRAAAARELGATQRIFSYKVKQHDIDPDRFKSTRRDVKTET